MKPLLKRITLFVLTLLFGVSIALFLSYKKIQSMDLKMVKPALDSNRIYARSLRFSIIDPWTSLIPFWTLTYSETPTDVNYTNPVLSINLLGHVVGAQPKEIWTTIEP